MNKQQLIVKVAKQAGVTQETVRGILNTLTEKIGEVLAEGEKVQLVGFGTFKVTERRAHKGRHPVTGKEISIPSSKVPSFTAGAELKKMVNQK